MQTNIYHNISCQVAFLIWCEDDNLPLKYPGVGAAPIDSVFPKHKFLSRIACETPPLPKVTQCHPWTTQPVSAWLFWCLGDRRNLGGQDQGQGGLAANKIRVCRAIIDLAGMLHTAARELARMILTILLVVCSRPCPKVPLWQRKIYIPQWTNAAKENSLFAVNHGDKEIFLCHNEPPWQKNSFIAVNHRNKGITVMKDISYVIVNNCAERKFLCHDDPYKRNKCYKIGIKTEKVWAISNRQEQFQISC